MIREVEYLSQPRAESFKPLAREAIISITGTGYPAENLLKGWARVLRLVFDDVERPIHGAFHFDESHAKTILHSLQSINGKVDKVFVHCYAGKSRSPAVALFIAQLYGIPGGIHVREEYNQMIHRVLIRAWRNSGGGRQ